MIKENILKTKERIERICAKIKKNPEEITIVAVSKGRTPVEIEEAIAAGIIDIGENRVQEAMVKYNALRTRRYAPGARWHMVGHLQTNKAKEAVKIFDLIQSVDSLRLAQEIDKQANKINKIQDILIEVNVAQEAAKFGLSPQEAITAAKEMSQLKNINIKGLMTIAPLADNFEKTRSYFRMLRELRDKLNSLQPAACSLQLSMGMTDDFEAAIEEGANMLRLGRAIFAG